MAGSAVLTGVVWTLTGGLHRGGGVSGRLGGGGGTRKGAPGHEEHEARAAPMVRRDDAGIVCEWVADMVVPWRRRHGGSCGFAVRPFAVRPGHLVGSPPQWQLPAGSCGSHPFGPGQLEVDAPGSVNLELTHDTAPGLRQLIETGEHDAPAGIPRPVGTASATVSQLEEVATPSSATSSTGAGARPVVSEISTPRRQQAGATSGSRSPPHAGARAASALAAMGLPVPLRDRWTRSAGTFG